MRRKPTFQELESRNLLTTFAPSLVKDISPGAESTQFESFYPSENHLYFTTNQGQLWRTDGSTDGTTYLAEAEPGWPGYGVPQFLDLQSGVTLFEVAGSDSNDVWRTDGTAEGTKEIMPSRRLTAQWIDVNDEWSLIIATNELDLEVWRVGAETEDNVLLASYAGWLGIRPQLVVQDSIAYLSVNHFFFRQDKQLDILIRTDGTAAGTVQVTENLAAPAIKTSHGVHFVSNEDDHYRLIRIEPGANLATPRALVSVPGPVRSLREHQDKAIFFFDSSDDGAENPTWQIAVSDGTESGTVTMEVDLPIREPVWHTELEGTLLFGDSYYATGLWRTDGTPTGTYQLSFGGYFGVLNGRAYISEGFQFSWEISHFTDGTNVFDAWIQIPPEPELLAGDASNFTVAPPPAPSWSIGENYISKYVNTSSNPGWPTISTFFAPDESGVLTEVGASWDETRRIVQVGDSWYIATSSDITVLGEPIVETTDRVDSESADALFRFHAIPQTGLYFAFGPTDDKSLWVLGPDRAVRKIGPVESVPPASFPVSGESVPWESDDFFFTRKTDLSGHELWVTDGSQQNTVEIDIWPGSESSNPEFVTWNGATLVIADSADHGRELWRIDGDFADSDSEAQSSYLQSIDVHDEDPFFSAKVMQPDTGVEYSWDLNDDGKFGDATGSRPRLKLDIVEALDPPITKNVFRPYHVRAIDSTGNVHVETSLLRIQNSRPAIVEVTGLPVRAEIGDEFELEVVARDKDNLTYTVDFGDGTIVEQPSQVFPHSYSRIGQYRVTISVRDQHGLSTSTSQSITVRNPDESATWRFSPGSVFGGNSWTTDIELIDTEYDGIIDRILTANLDGPAQKFGIPPSSGINPWTPCQEREHSTLAPSGYAVAAGSFSGCGVATQFYATKNGLEGTEGHWDFGAEGTESRDIALADLNGDDELDVFVANFQNADGNPTGDFVLLNKHGGPIDNASGSNFLLSSAVGDYHSSSVELGDFNGDGHIDAVTASPDAIHVWFNDGKANFAESTQQLSLGAEHVAIGDLDSDGDLDLIGARNGGNPIWFNDGRGRFVLSTQQLGSAKSAHVAIGYLDNDNHLDAMFANGVGDASTVWLNDGAGQFNDSGARLAADANSTRIALRAEAWHVNKSIYMAVAGLPNHVYHIDTDRSGPRSARPPQLTVEHGRLLSISMTFDESVASMEPPLIYHNSDAGRATELLWNADRTAFTWDTSELDIREGRHSFLGDAVDELGNENRVRASIVVTRDGDLDEDFQVDADDFAILSRNFGKSMNTRAEGDVDGDGVVGFSDFLIMSRDFGEAE